MRRFIEVEAFLRQLNGKKAVAMALTIAMTASSYGAEFLARAGKPLNGATSSEVFVRGEIVPGDVDVLAAFLRSARRVGSLTIDSPGGVVEAMVATEPVSTEELRQSSFFRRGRFPNEGTNARNTTHPSQDRV